ncbi:hypothetical protein [Levilactobacillus namurensis]|uniref:hypothetical protein n=1 Tax=Levilactobacillus namurensis TaxID=380393 RepID=UPI0026ED4438|nr:hypothetical protein [Levilactobacillus namurensis]
MTQPTFETALAAYQAAKWSTASAEFTTLYQARQTPELNRYLAVSLFQDQQYLAAEQIAAENDGAYLTSDTWFNWRLTIALHNQQFIFARELCELPQAAAWRTAGIQRITTAEQTASTQLAATQNVIAKQFYHLGDAPLREQQQRLLRAHQLPLAKFLQGTRYLLVDPFLHPLLRATLLEELYRLRVDLTVQLHWLDDQVHTVATRDLIGVTQGKAAQAALAYLQEQIAQNNPGLAANVRQTLNLQLMLLYPFADEIITQPQAWVDWLAGRPLDQTVSETDCKVIADWQKRLTTHLEALFAAVNDENSENS